MSIPTLDGVSVGGQITNPLSTTQWQMEMTCALEMLLHRLFWEAAFAHGHDLDFDFELMLLEWTLERFRDVYEHVFQVWGEVEIIGNQTVDCG